MWTISIDGASAHVPGTSITLVEPKLTKAVNSADKLEFRITADHPLYDTIINGVFTSRYEVERDGAVVSRGRILSRDVSPLDASCKVVCEGELAYLADAVMPEYDFSGSPRQFVAQFVDAYASQCDESNAIELGEVTAYDGNDYIVRGNESPSNLLSELLAKTCNSSTAGYIQVRNVNGVRYLDWLATLEYAGAQEIVKGSNLLDISDELDGSDIVTAIMPLGSKEEGAHVKLPDEPDGQVDGDVWRRGDYMYSKRLVSQYGWHASVVEWNDVTRPANLKSRAKTAVSELSVLSTFALSAVDLSDAGYDIAHLDIGQRVAVKCDGIDETVLVTGAVWEMDNPCNSGYVFGKIKSASRAITESGEKSDGAGWSRDVTSFLTHVDEEGSLFKPHRTAMWGVMQSDMDEGSDPPTYDGYPAAYISVQQAESGQWVGERGNRIAMRAYDISMLNDGGTIGATSGDIILEITRMDNNGDNLALIYGSGTTPAHRVVFDADGLNIYGSAYYNGTELGGTETVGSITRYMPLTYTCTTSDAQLATTATLDEYDPLGIISTSGNNIVVAAGYIVEVSAYSTFQGTTTHQNGALTIYAGTGSAISSQSKVAQAFASFWSTTAHYSYMGITPVIVRCASQTYISLAARSTTAGAVCLSGAGSGVTSTLPSTVLTVKVIGKI